MASVVSGIYVFECVCVCVCVMCVVGASERGKGGYMRAAVVKSVRLMHFYAAETVPCTAKHRVMALPHRMYHSVKERD